MPFIQVHLLEGITTETKRELIRGITETTASILDTPPGTIRLVIDEVPLENWGTAGISMKEKLQDNVGSSETR
ncbi:tautomerase family protein [Alicyclobacillus fastidiosus]|uniref:Tautomerase n=1 Tax=Alicyclobacillus fastidiosus TaxID=392011 RepID=A0ABV5ACK2_9BACL|nr:2-hydroxymuconate tautomerase family protein [Alicyclobacillus fastidiosus]WEH11506.1 2-hydroxymuconate tautomerase family protein [Alicyclobacillus fastidiosus]